MAAFLKASADAGLSVQALAAGEDSEVQFNQADNLGASTNFRYLRLTAKLILGTTDSPGYFNVATVNASTLKTNTLQKSDAGDGHLTANIDTGNVTTLFVTSVFETPEANIQVANVGTIYNTSRIETPEANITTANVITLYATSKAETPEANITVANVDTLYLTTYGDINKVDILEANITVANVATAYIDNLTIDTQLQVGSSSTIITEDKVDAEQVNSTTANISTAYITSKGEINEANITVANVATLYVTGPTNFQDSLYVGENIEITGNLTVFGDTTTIESTTITVDDKNLELASVATPTDTTADGAGITIKGATDKTILYTDGTKSFDLNQQLNVNADGATEIRIDGTRLANSTNINVDSINLEIANVTTINVVTAYVTGTLDVPKIDVEEANATVANIATAYITTNAVINKEDVEESNVTVANIATAYVTTAATIADATLSTAKVSDLTETRVTFSGADGELTDDAELSFVSPRLTAGEFTTPEANLTVANVGTLFVSGDATVHGDITIGGEINLGDADTDSLTIAADLTSDIIPNATDTYDLGTDAKRWKDIYLSGAAHASSKITTPEANITVANVATIYVTDSMSVPKLGTDEANVTVANIATAYITTNAVIEKEDVNESNVLVANISTAYITTKGVINEANITVANVDTLYATTLDVPKLDTDEANVLVANIGTLYATTEVVTGTIKASDGTSAITIADSTGKVTLSGDLQVDGTTTTLNSTTLDVDDINITVAKGAADGAAADGAGLNVDGAGATLTYTDSTKSWDVNQQFNINADGATELRLEGTRLANTTNINIDSIDLNIANIETANVGTIYNTKRIESPEANVTVANVATLYVTSSATIPTISSNKISTPEANITIANVTTAYITTNAVIEKEDVNEANVLVSNTGTLYVTTAATVADATLTTAKVSDLTSGRVVLAGADGEIEDSDSLTFDGTTLNSAARITTAEANVTVVNVGTAYITTAATIFKEDVEEANITVANVGTLYATSVTASSIDATISGDIKTSTIKASDDTTSLTIADSTGKVTVSSAITIPEANVTVANVATMYVTENATLATAKVSDLTETRVVLAGTDGELEDHASLTFDGTTLDSAVRITTPEANVTVANVGTLYATTNAVINKEDVSEANITVANVSTLYVTNEAVLPGINVTKMDVPEANITVANVGTAYITTGSVINEANITVANVATLYASGATIDDITTNNGMVVGENLTVSGNLTVQGTTTTISSTTINVDDKNLELGAVDTPTDTTADGGGITLKGATDKTFNWVDSTDSWTSSENLDLASGKTIKINGTDILSSTTLGSGVTSSSLTSLGTIASLNATYANLTKFDAPEANLTVANVGTLYASTFAVDDLTADSVTVGSGTTHIRSSEINVSTLNVVTIHTTTEGTIAGRDQRGGHAIISGGIIQASAQLAANTVAGAGLPHFKVTVGNKTPKNPYYNKGGSKCYYIDGIEQPTLQLGPGKYVFDTSDPSLAAETPGNENTNHHLKFYTHNDKTRRLYSMTEDGMNRAAYTGDDWNGHTFHWHDGPVGTANSHTHLEIGYWTYGNNETPAGLAQISYQCNNHDFMGSTVHIVGSANGIFYNRAELTTTNISTANIETLYVTSKLGGSGGMNDASCVPEANITVANVATLYVTEKLAAQQEANISVANIVTLYATTSTTDVAISNISNVVTVNAATAYVSSVVSDSLTSGRVVIAGTGGVLEDNGNLTFDGTTLDSAARITTPEANIQVANVGTVHVTSGINIPEGGITLTQYGGALSSSTNKLWANSTGAFFGTTRIDGATVDDATALAIALG